MFLVPYALVAINHESINESINQNFFFLQYTHVFRVSHGCILVVEGGLYVDIYYSLWYVSMYKNTGTLGPVTGDVLIY